MCRTEIVFEAFAQPEANAPLGSVLDLDLPEWDIVVSENVPQVSGLAAEFVDTDLDGRRSGLAAGRSPRCGRPWGPLGVPARVCPQFSVGAPQH